MIQIADVTATTALMPVSFHIVFIARSPKAATSDCRRSFGRYCSADRETVSTMACVSVSLSRISTKGVVRDGSNGPLLESSKVASTREFAAGNLFYISAVWEKVRDVFLHTALRRCPLWVKRQTFALQKVMFALPPKATSSATYGMSAKGPKRTIRWCITPHTNYRGRPGSN
jgi:hypothetical protein